MIEINNLTKIPVKEELLQRTAKKVFQGENVKKALSIALIGPEEIRKLNKKYLGKDKLTDVLSFPSEKDLGEVVICLKAVKENSKDFEKELKFVLIHGILHLLGYDHEKSWKEAEKMREKEKFYLCQEIE